MKDCVFCQIIEKKIPSKVFYENKNLLVFHDINPQAPVHLLIVPRKHTPSIEDFEIDDWFLSEEIFKVVKKLKETIPEAKDGYRLVVNSGRASGQMVPHLHFHFLAGRNFSWPAG